MRQVYAAPGSSPVSTTDTSLTRSRNGIPRPDRSAIRPRSFFPQVVRQAVGLRDGLSRDIGARWAQGIGQERYDEFHETLRAIVDLDN